MSVENVLLGVAVYLLAGVVCASLLMRTQRARRNLARCADDGLDLEGLGALSIALLWSIACCMAFSAWREDAKNGRDHTGEPDQ